MPEPEAPVAPAPAAPAPPAPDPAAPLLGTPPAPAAAPAPGSETPAPGATDKAPAAPGAPEKYEFTLAPELPPVDPSVLGKFEPVFRKMNLTSEAAQPLVEAYAQHVVAETQARTEALAKQVGDWNRQIEADPALGGAAFKDNVQTAIRGVDRVGGKELADLLAQTGLGSHPTVFKAFLEVGKLFKEDSLMPSGGAAPGAQKSTADALWGDSPLYAKK